jgi:hypothetical protein
MVQLLVADFDGQPGVDVLPAVDGARPDGECEVLQDWILVGCFSSVTGMKSTRKGEGQSGVPVRA